MRVGTRPNQGSMYRGGAERLVTEVPLRAPPPQLSAASVSAHRAAFGRRKPCGAWFHSPPWSASGSFISALGLEQRQGVAQRRPNGPFAHLAKAGRKSTGVPKVTRTRYPPSQSAKLSRSARAEPGVGKHQRFQPAAPAEGSKGRWGGSPEVTQRVPRGEKNPSARLPGGAPRRTWQGPVHSVAHSCVGARRWRWRARDARRLNTRWAGNPGRGRARAPGHRGCTGEPAGCSWGGCGEESSGGRRRRSHRPGPAGSAPASRCLQPRGEGRGRGRSIF